MILSGGGNRPAIIIGNEIYSFTQLSDHVDQQVQNFKSTRVELLKLTATRTILFITQFLAGLKLGVPVCVFSADIPEESKKRQEQILNKSLHADCALILFTSGSSGEPKAVQLSRKNIEANTDAVIATLDFKTASQQYLFLPLSYSFGLLGQLLPALKVGLTTHIIDTFIDFKTKMENSEIDGMVSGVPSHWETILLLKQTIPQTKNKITHIISAGSYFSEDLRKRIKASFPAATIFNNYGQTEASPRILSIPSTDANFFSTSTGYPVPGITTALTADNELKVCGPQIMLGYLGDAETTDQKIKDGWLHTGDIAKQNENGLVEILGRKDDLIKIAGERVSLNEIESALSNVPGCIEAAVFYEDDPIYEKKITALIVANAPMIKPQVIKWLKTYLNSVRMPREFYLVEKIPRSSNGKIQRSELKNIKRNPLI